MAESRVRERERVFCLLFGAEFQKEESAEALLEIALEDEELSEETLSDYVRETFLGAFAYGPEAMELAEKSARGWTAERMSPAMRALLKLSIYEVMKSEIPVKIAINEALELCKKYEEDQAVGFLNGVLGTVSRTWSADKCEDK